MYRKRYLSILFSLAFVIALQLACRNEETKNDLSAHEVLTNYGHMAFAYGGYRTTTRNNVPTVEQLKEDMIILNALGCHLIRTYHTQQFAQVSNLLEAIKQLNTEHPDFKMYVMLGSWIQCKDAWTSNPIHNQEDIKNNRAEIDKAIEFAQKYPDIIKIIAVGNEAMVHWASGYFVSPNIILKYVRELQTMKQMERIDSSIWITSSDNFASWGGGHAEYHTSDLDSLIKEVDYISLHTYPFHDTHYNPNFWYSDDTIDYNSDYERAKVLISRAIIYAQKQYENTKKYIHEISPNKEIHIGETGWASIDNHFYGANGSAASDEVKQSLYYHAMREWTNHSKIACFYFEAFDEPWKDDRNINGSENHFGLIEVDGKVKFPLWAEFEESNLSKYTRGEQLVKTFEGDSAKAISSLLNIPPKDSNLFIHQN